MKCIQTGKRIYYEKAEALDTAAHEKSIGHAGVPLRPYICEFCGHWHLSHKKAFRGF